MDKLSKKEYLNSPNLNSVKYLNYKDDNSNNNIYISTPTTPTDNSIEINENIAFQILKPINIYLPINEKEKIQELIKTNDGQNEKIKNIQKQNQFNARRKEKKNVNEDEFYPFEEESYCLIF